MKRLLTSLCVATVASAAYGASPFYTGANIGYLVSTEAPYFTARVGYEYLKDEEGVHSIEAEVGYTYFTKNYVDRDMIPIMANYRIAQKYSSFDAYFGLGAGVTTVKDDYSYANQTVGAFSAQAFLGVDYAVSEKASLTLAARYLWVSSPSGSAPKIGDDVSLEGGFRIRF